MAFLTRESAMRRVAFPFLFGSVYWVVASKSIFFHIYYSLIIVLTLTFGAAYFIYLEKFEDNAEIIHVRLFPLPYSSSGARCDDRQDEELSRCAEVGNHQGKHETG